MCEFVCVQNLLCTSMRSSVVVVAVRMQKTVQVLFHVGDAATFLLVLFFVSSFSFRSSPTKRVCRCASSLSIFMSGQFMFEPKWKSVEPSEAYLLAPPDIHALTHTEQNIMQLSRCIWGPKTIFFVLQLLDVNQMLDALVKMRTFLVFLLHVNCHTDRFEKCESGQVQGFAAERTLFFNVLCVRSPLSSFFFVIFPLHVCCECIFLI